MKAIVLKAFDYSTDGVTSRLLAKDAEEEISDDLAAGLVAEGFIAPKREPAKTKSAASASSESLKADAKPAATAKAEQADNGKTAGE